MKTVGKTRRSRKLILPLAVAAAMLIAMTAVVSADSAKAVWQGTGIVLYAGPSMDPTMPTATESEFKYGKDGRIRSVRVHTFNELVTGILGDGAGGSAITNCRDSEDGATCEQLNGLLTNAQVTSMHNSSISLDVVQQHAIPVPGVGDVPVLSGKIRGSLKGVFSISDAGGSATGTSHLQIRRNSSGTYACFLVSGTTLIPSTSLDPCVDDTGGMLFPIFFDVQDAGRFEVGNGIGSMDAIESLQGRVRVNAVADLLTPSFGGTIEVLHSTAMLSNGGELEPE